MPETEYSFVTNYLAIYGAAVGSLALLLNFLRYRHAVIDRKAKVVVELVEKMSANGFEERIKERANSAPYFAPQATITHEIKVRNLGNVSVHIQDAWVETVEGIREDAFHRRKDSGFQRASRIGNLEIVPRSSQSFSLFSDTDVYLKPKKAYVLDETGKKWRSR